MNTDIIRQIVLDTETTGMNKMGVHYIGHKIIEIGAVEIVNRHITGKNFHVYIKPNRRIDLEAFNIHGISDEFLFDKPTFNEIYNEFINFIKNSELIIHNAPFDVGFINYEFKILDNNLLKINNICKIVDSLKLARKIFPGKRNNLDALCHRYNIDNSQRTLHSALIDAKILADVFLLMTGGQMSMFSDIENEYIQDKNDIKSLSNKQISNNLKIIYANKEEITDHNKQLDLIEKKNGLCLWRI